MRDKHQVILNRINNKLEIIKRFSGGMSNYTYLVKDIDDNHYTFRVPFENGKHFVNYETEILNIKLIENLNLNNKTLFFDTKTGIKLSTFIEGHLPTDEMIDYYKISESLKKLHNSNLVLTNDYSPLTRLNKYESLINNINLTYFKLKEEFIRYYLTDLYDKFNFPCHNDCQLNNLISSNENIYLLDWEFAGNNDYLYDIAAFGGQNFNNALYLLEIYNPLYDNNDLKRLYSWKFFQCLQWYLVASYKEIIGASIELNIDFKTVAEDYLIKSQYFYDKFKNL